MDGRLDRQTESLLLVQRVNADVLYKRSPKQRMPILAADKQEARWPDGQCTARPYNIILVSVLVA